MSAFLHPVTIGIAAGLFFGNQIGVFGLSFIAIKLRFAKMPTDATWLQLYGVSALCGIGFTMSLFIASLAFEHGDFEERVEKPLALCELCGEVVAPVDQLRYLARRLGPIASANPTLLMMTFDELGVSAPGVHDADGDILRSDRLAVQCPKCRRKTALAA